MYYIYKVFNSIFLVVGPPHQKCTYAVPHSILPVNFWPIIFIWFWISIKFPTKWYIMCLYFEKIYFLVTRASGLKSLPSLIQYGRKMTTDQNMSPTCFLSPNHIFTRFEVKPNPLKYAHSTYTSSKSIVWIYFLWIN